jgi:hypothetical protein
MRALGAWERSATAGGRPVARGPSPLRIPFAAGVTSTSPPLDHAPQLQRLGKLSFRERLCCLIPLAA